MVETVQRGPMVPVPVQGLTGVVEISSGKLHTCALTKDKKAWCWGYNYHGQLGDGTKTNSSVPLLVKHPDFRGPVPPSTQ